MRCHEIVLVCFSMHLFLSLIQLTLLAYREPTITQKPLDFPALQDQGLVDPIFSPTLEALMRRTGLAAASEFGAFRRLGPGAVFGRYLHISGSNCLN